MTEDLFNRLLTSASFSYGFQFVNYCLSQYFYIDNFTGFVEFSIPCFLLLDTSNSRHLLLSSLLLIWSLRLTTFLIYRMFVRDPRDTRLDKFREKGTNPFFWAVHGTWGFVCSFPVTFSGSVSNQPPLNLLDLLGLATWMIGMYFESITDWIKLRAHLDNRKSWSYALPLVDMYKFCRHPNFFGEFLIWLGIFIPSLNLNSPHYYFCMLSPLLTIVIMLGEAIFLTEVSNNKRFSSNPLYHQYKKTTSIFWPLPSKFYSNLPKSFRRFFFFDWSLYDKKLSAIRKDG